MRDEGRNRRRIAWEHGLAYEPHVKNILDIGTGTGIDRFDARPTELCAIIDAIDIDSRRPVSKLGRKCSGFAFCRQNTRSIPASLCGYIARSMTQIKYDLIVSNPPYFINSLKCPDNKRNRLHAHTDSSASIRTDCVITRGLLALFGRNV